MADPVKPKTGYEKWQETIDQAKSDPRWHAYDPEIILAVSEFNGHLSSMKGYFPLDWRLIKAVIWTESGGPDSRAWNSRPMQIGNPGDPGLAALLSGKEGGEIIMPPELKSRLNMGNAGIPSFNIRAGIAYLLMRCASYGFVQVMDARDAKVYEYTVQAGGRLSGQDRAHARDNRGGAEKIEPHCGRVETGAVDSLSKGFDSEDSDAVAAYYDRPDCTKIQYQPG